jgi:hypothetical protein
LIELLVFSLIAFGIAWGVGHSELSYPFRLAISKVPRVGSVIISGLECFGCLSWHIGAISYFLHYAPSPLDTWWKTAFFASASSLVLARLSGLSESASPEGGDDRRREAADPRQTEAER